MRDGQDRTWRGFNLFLKEDQTALLAILRGEFAIRGLSNKRLRALLAQKTSAQIARIPRRAHWARTIHPKSGNGSSRRVAKNKTSSKVTGSPIG